MFDGDYAGRGYFKNGSSFITTRSKCICDQLPSGMDPDEYIGKYGNEAF